MRLGAVVVTLEPQPVIFVGPGPGFDHALSPKRDCIPTTYALTSGDGTYVAGVTLAGNVNGDGLSCSGTAVWLDDSEVRNNAQVGLDISGGCEAHLRRTVVRTNAEGGIDQTGGVLSLKNSVSAANGGTFSAFGGISLDGVEIDITYSTIAGNDSQNAGMSFRCSRH